MNQEQLNARPELIMGPNPLIECAAPFIPFSKWGDKLDFEPLAGKPWKAIPPESREALLDFSKQHFVATRLVTEPAAGLQRLFRLGLSARNPLEASDRVRTTRIATATELREVRCLPALDGAGGMWAGPTGIGKTSVALRVLEAICPEQVIVHDACPKAGWLRFVQCCYLYVDQPSNGTRGGLLHRILVKLDELLGTDYSEQHNKTRNLDILLVTVTKVLVLHRVALLVVDEKQGRNFRESPWQLEFVLFYLSLMNLGISVVLLGNPVAFEHLKTFTQVIRRFSVGGNFDLLPATENEPWWKDDFVPFMSDFLLVDRSQMDTAKHEHLCYVASGGNPGLFKSYHTEVQRSALRRKGTEAIVTLEDYEEAKKSPRYRDLLSIATAFHQEDDGTYVDIGASAHPVESGERVIPVGVAQVITSMLSKYKAEQTRAANVLAKKIKALEGMTEDDLRLLGVTQDMLANLVAGTPFAKAVEKRKAKAPQAAKSK